MNAPDIDQIAATLTTRGAITYANEGFDRLQSTARRVCEALGHKHLGYCGASWAAAESAALAAK